MKKKEKNQQTKISKTKIWFFELRKRNDNALTTLNRK